MANDLEDAIFSIEELECQLKELKEEVENVNREVVSLSINLSKESDKRLLLTILFGLFLVYFIFLS